MVSLIILVLVLLTIYACWLLGSIFLRLRRRRRGVKASLAQLERASTMTDAMASLGGRPGVVADFIRNAYAEMQASAGLPVEGQKERVALILEQLREEEVEEVGRGAGRLAAIAIVAPFLGLWATVFDIAGYVISVTRANPKEVIHLGYLAPANGVSLLTALLAGVITLIGYVAVARATARYGVHIGDGLVSVMQQASRDLDRQTIGLAAVRSELER